MADTHHRRNRRRTRLRCARRPSSWPPCRDHRRRIDRWRTRPRENMPCRLRSGRSSRCRNRRLPRRHCGRRRSSWPSHTGARRCKHRSDNHSLRCSSNRRNTGRMARRSRRPPHPAQSHHRHSGAAARPGRAQHHRRHSKAKELRPWPKPGTQLFASSRAQPITLRDGVGGLPPPAPPARAQPRTDRSSARSSPRRTSHHLRRSS